MRTLLLMRHAKSDWASGARMDKERPLNARGRKDAPRMAQWLAESGITPDYALVSNAQRTAETWELMQSSFPAAQTQYSNVLYHAGPEDMLDTINSVDSETSTTMLLIAHQPGMAALTRLLTGALKEPHLDAAFGHFSTAAIAVLQSPAQSWHDVAHGSCELVAYQKPKAL